MAKNPITTAYYTTRYAEMCKLKMEIENKILSLLWIAEYAFLIDGI